MWQMIMRMMPGDDDDDDEGDDEGDDDDNDDDIGLSGNYGNGLI